MQSNSAQSVLPIPALLLFLLLLLLLQPFLHLPSPFSNFSNPSPPFSKSIAWQPLQPSSQPSSKVSTHNKSTLALVSCPTRLWSSWWWRPLIWKKIQLRKDPIEKRTNWEKIRLRKDPIEKRSDWEKTRLRNTDIEWREDWDLTEQIKKKVVLVKLINTVNYKSRGSQDGQIQGFGTVNY